MGCDCCNDERANTGRDPADATGGRDGTNRGTTTGTILDRTLPVEVVDALSRFHETDSEPTTDGEWVDALHAEVAGADWLPPTVDDLCTTDDSPHRAVVDGDQFHFICVLDAVILAVLRDSPASIGSASPIDDTPITAAVSPTDVTVDPPDAVISFGVAADPDVDGEPTPADHYAQLCPYIHAFPDRDAYERWAETVDAPTDHFPFADGLALARAIADVA